MAAVMLVSRMTVARRVSCREDDHHITRLNFIGEDLCGFKQIAGMTRIRMPGLLDHPHHVFFIEAGGVEYVLVLAAALFIITIFGTGRVSLDGVLTRG